MHLVFGPYYAELAEVLQMDKHYKQIASPTG